jgi:hypothetical protein
MMPRFVFENHADKNGDYNIYDTSQGRHVIIAQVDQEYVERFERALKLLEAEDAVRAPQF